mgnify:CR=1 FL=1
MAPFFSIITVCYNSEKTIGRTLDSMLAQTNQDYEYIIIDGASTDQTMNLLRKYEPRFEGRMKIYSEDDDGIYDAMNKGIHKASGQFIGMVNSDDFYDPKALQNIREAVTGQRHQILYGFQRVLRKNQEIEINFVNDCMIGESMISHPSCFVSASVYRDFGMYDTRYKSAADLDFLLRIKKQTDTQFVPVYKIITNFMQGGMSSSGIGMREAARIRHKYGVYSGGRCRYVIMQSYMIDFVHWIKKRRH